MANSVKFTINIDDNGSLQLVAKDAKKAAAGIKGVDDATQKANKSRGKYQKQEKGIGQAGLSSSKGFSKMSSGITGGLVPAYAVLAANVFAVTAAFGALSRAAKVEQLTQGLTVLGTASGIAMKTLSNGLREATGNALSLEDAMRGVALATSAGFDSSTIERLGKVAKNTSNALGRDLNDSFNRLVKGATKLEPELLDELGIMVRLDDATAKYAQQNGKLVGALTLTERRQAFMNAVLEEGETKFGALANSVDASPFDKLAATFTDMSTSLLNILNVVLIPFVAVLSASPTALFGTMIMFGTGIARVMVPALFDAANRLKDVTAQTAINARESIKGMTATKARTGSARKLISAIVAGTQTEADYTKAIKGENLSMARNATLLKAGTIDQTEYDIRKKASTAATAQFTAGLEAETASHQANQQVGALQLIQDGKIGKGLRQGTKDINDQRKARKLAAAGAKGLAVVNLFLAGSYATLSASIALAGTALLAALPYIGLIILALGALAAMFKWVNESMKSDEQKQYEAGTEKLTETTEELAASFAEVDKAMKGQSDTINTVVGRYTAMSNATRELNSVVDEALKNADSMSRWDKVFNSDEPINQVNDLIKGSTSLSQAFEEVYGKGETLQSVMKGKPLKEMPGIVQKLYEHTGKAAASIVQLSEAVDAANTPIADFFLAMKEKTSVDAIVDAFDLLVTSATEVGSASADGFLAAFEEQASQGQLNLLGVNTEDVAKYKAIQKALQKAKEEGDTRTQEALEGEAVRLKGLLEIEIGRVAQVLKTVQTTERLSKIRLKGYQDDLKAAKMRKYEAEGANNAFTATNNIIEEKATLIQAEIDKNTQLAKDATDDADLQAKILILQKERLDLLNTKLIPEEKSMMLAQNALNLATTQNQVNKAGLDMANKMLSAKKASLAADITMAQLTQKSANRDDPYRANADLTSADNLKIEKQFYEQKKTNALTTHNLDLTRIDMEYALLGAQLHLLKEQMNVINAKYQAENKTSDNLVDTGALDSAISGLDGTKVAAKEASGKVYNALIAQINEDLAGAKDTALADSIGATGSITDRIMALVGEGGALNSETEGVDLEDKVAGFANAMQPMLDIMGPEGAMMQAVIGAAVATTDAWGTAFDKMGVEGASGLDKAAAAAEAASATVGAIGSMLAASSQGRIAEIDNEIEAEKRRDGQSAASVAKIKKLEAKKEATKKKAFETDKKVKMAQTVMNTAAGIMNFMSEGNIPMAVATGIMGAIQLATIAGTSYQGGGNSAPSGKVEAVSMGKRTNTIDLARGNSASGELGYMRGESGQGTGATNFKPGSAFTGARYRASGGETAGFMVGEQGPEMFIPDRSGRIAPADETASMGSTSNVNFNISAVDAAGVEDVLVRQKGHIIRMIREAANEHGQPFLEDISDGSYTS